MHVFPNGKLDYIPNKKQAVPRDGNTAWFC